MPELRRFKFMIALILEIKKIESDYETKHSTFYLNRKAEAVNNESYIDNVFESIYIKIISNIQKSFGRGSGLITDLIIDHNINISKQNPLAGCSYIELPKD